MRKIDVFQELVERYESSKAAYEKAEKDLVRFLEQEVYEMGMAEGRKKINVLMQSPSENFWDSCPEIICSVIEEVTKRGTKILSVQKTDGGVRISIGGDEC